MARRALVAAALLAASFAVPAHACAGEVCEAINTVCYTLRNRPCVR